jgi:hypothetical protein
MIRFSARFLAQLAIVFLLVRLLAHGLSVKLLLPLKSLWSI